MKWILILSFLYSIGFADNYYYSNNQKIYITPSKYRTAKVYFDEDDKEIRLTNKILLKLKDNVYFAELKKEFEIELVKKYANNLYLVKSKNNVLETANRLYEDDRTLFAHPDLIRKVIKR